MNARRLIAPLLTGLAGALFVGLALYRRLNFDEALALRAGWLDLAGEPSAPAFLMPWTLLVGALGHAIDDPGTVLRLLRLLSSSGVAAAFFFAARAAGLSAAGIAGASWLALANATFLTHGLEFRYDAAVLILLLLGARELVRPGSKVPLGVLAALLALHHLKGAFFAVGVVGIQFLLTGAGERRRVARNLLLGAASTLGAWVTLLVPLGLVGRFVESVSTFFALATGGHREPVGATLGPILLADLAWWMAILVALALGAGLRRQAARDPRDLIPAALAVLGVVFWVVHPHAWAYLAALPVPFLAISVVRSMERMARIWRWSALAAVLGALLQVASAAALPLAHVPRALAAPIAPEIGLLRGLRAGMRPDDRVLDPAGLLYFVRPCFREWYLDTLLVERVRAGTWMSELGQGVPADCTLVLNTYRLNALPRGAREALTREFVPLESGLAVRRTRPADQSLPELLGDGRVESFW